MYRNPSHRISWDFKFLNQGTLLEKNHDILNLFSLKITDDILNEIKKKFMNRSCF